MESKNLEITRKTASVCSYQQTDATKFEHYFYLIPRKNTLCQL